MDFFAPDFAMPFRAEDVLLDAFAGFLEAIDLPEILLPEIFLAKTFLAAAFFAT